MPKECAICKLPADVSAQIFQGDRTVNAFLCNNCLNRISKQHRIGNVKPLRDETPDMNPEQTGYGKDTSATKRNPWKIAFFGLLAVFVFVVVTSLGSINILLKGWTDGRQPVSEQPAARIITPSNGTSTNDSSGNTTDDADNAGNSDVLNEAKVGDTVKIGDWELTLNRVKFYHSLRMFESYDDLLNDGRKENVYLTPPTEEDLKNFSNLIMSAREGRCFLWVQYTLKYTGKTRIYFSTLSICADYDDGYMYELSECSNIGFSFEPRQSPVEKINYGDVPVEIEENPEIPLRITFNTNSFSDKIFDGETIVFRVR